MKNLLKGVVVAVIGLSITMGTANAADCKGKSATACSTDNSCSWVNGYERKDGISVSAHCRVSAKKKSLDKTTKAKTKIKSKTADVTSKVKDEKSILKNKVSTKK